MSGIITSATIALTSVTMVLAASLPEISQSLAPIFENGNEYAANAMGLMIAIPGIALLTLIAGAARD